MKTFLLTVCVLLAVCSQSFAKDKEPKESIETLNEQLRATEDPMQKEVIGRAIAILLEKEENKRMDALKDLDTPSMKKARKEIEKLDKKEKDRAEDNERNRRLTSLTCPYEEDKKLVWVSGNVASHYRENQAAVFKVHNNLNVPVDITILTGALYGRNGVPVVKNLCPGGFMIIRQRSFTYYDYRTVQFLAVIREENGSVSTVPSQAITLQTSGGGFYDYGSYNPPVDWYIGDTNATSSYTAGSSGGGVEAATSSTASGVGSASASTRGGTSAGVGAVNSGMSSILGAFRSGANRR